MATKKAKNSSKLVWQYSDGNTFTDCKTRAEAENFIRLQNGGAVTKLLKVQKGKETTYQAAGWSYEEEYLSAQRKAKTGKATVYNENDNFVCKVYTSIAAEICEAMNAKLAPVQMIVAVMEGGCVSDILGLRAKQDYTIWDWDDFNDAPKDYWDDHSCQASIRALFDPEVLKEIEAKVKEVADEEAAAEEAQKLKDPFWMVNEVPEITVAEWETVVIALRRKMNGTAQGDGKWQKHLRDIIADIHNEQKHLLDVDDWVEIYYALEDCSGDVATGLMLKIGADGTNMTAWAGEKL